MADQPMSMVLVPIEQCGAVVSGECTGGAHVCGRKRRHDERMHRCGQCEHEWAPLRVELADKVGGARR